MKTNEIRKQLDMLKIHVDQLENWLKQTMDTIYDLESKILDIEDVALVECEKDWLKRSSVRN
jgi:hypothetical protein